jgi:hypothetical protein
MLIDQMPETTLEVKEKFTSITDVNITALQSAGEECSSGQAGHETHDSSDHILVCEYSSGDGKYYWRDTGRVMSR